MDLLFSRIGLVGKTAFPRPSGQNSHPLAENAAPLLGQVASFLQAQGCQVVAEAQTAQQIDLGMGGKTTHSAQAKGSLEIQSLANLGADCQAVVVVGGDGTMLSYVCQLAGQAVPLIGINQGRLGFITDIQAQGFEAVLQPMLFGQYEKETRPLVQAQVWRGDELIFDTLALNDVVVYRGEGSAMVEVRVEVGAHFVANQRADGIIVATPTGSTAYALSSGGPLLHPAMGGWVLVPIAPHSLSNRPIVLPDTEAVCIEILSHHGAVANFDRQTFTGLQLGDKLQVRRSAHHIGFLHPKGWSYFDTLRKKLHWNLGTSQ